MKATLQFNLDDAEDRMAHLRAVKSLDMALAMWEFAGALRGIVDTSEDGKWIDEGVVWSAWNDALEKHGVLFDELIR